MILISLILFVGLVGAALLGKLVHRYIPEDHLNDSSRDSVKLAMGLVATMTALVLGLLVSSAKDGYDTKRSEVIQMAAKVAFLDRALAMYGPEAARRSRRPSPTRSGASGRQNKAGLLSWRRTNRWVTRFISPSNECRRTMIRNAHLRHKWRPLRWIWVSFGRCW